MLYIFGVLRFGLLLVHRQFFCYLCFANLLDNPKIIAIIEVKVVVYEFELFLPGLIPFLYEVVFELAHLFSGSLQDHLLSTFQLYLHHLFLDSKPFDHLIPNIQQYFSLLSSQLRPNSKD